MPVQFQQRKEDESLIELTPLIDVIFLLLVFFMLSSTFLNSSLELTLPQLSEERTPTQTPVVVGANAQGALTVNGEAVAMDALVDVLAAALEETGERRVFLRGDRNLRYQQIVEIMESAGQAGAGQVNFVYEQAEP